MNDFTPERLHCLLTRHIIETGHAPALDALAALAGSSRAEVEAALRRLEAMHGLILVPGSTQVWSLHPFALMPTAFWVRSEGGGWWANCAWCSLGIAAAVGAGVTISTSAGAEGLALRFTVEGGAPSQRDLLMHFPEGPARWWDNPYCPCGNILFFTSAAEIDAWCVRHGRPRGAVLDIETGIKLAGLWFGDYASPGWRRKTPQQGEAIFRELGLDSTFWRMPGNFR